jgi:Arc/MetJ-type ribon-helix-helix transcriptional regulator
MTTTVKLPEHLEHALRQRCQAEGRTLSEVMRDALTAYLAQPHSTVSAYELGADVFGRYAGDTDLAEQRKSHLHALWDHKGGTGP